MFVCCEKCGKKLIERLPNGLWKFKFGRRDRGLPVVDMEIHGSIKMSCLKRTCDHINLLTYFPKSGTVNKKEVTKPVYLQQSNNGMGI